VECFLAVSPRRTTGYAKSPQRGPIVIYGEYPVCTRCVPGVYPVCTRGGWRNALCLQPFSTVCYPLPSVSYLPPSRDRPFNLRPIHTQTSRMNRSPSGPESEPELLLVPQLLLGCRGFPERFVQGGDVRRALDGLGAIVERVHAPSAARSPPEINGGERLPDACRVRSLNSRRIGIRNAAASGSGNLFSS
jgi:hypothetical protein